MAVKPGRQVRRRDLTGRRQYRIIPSRFPPIEIFETLADPADLEILYAIEGLTNDRLRAAAGDLYRVPKEDWVTGPGATVVMAAFTHVGRPTRFSDGTHGVYYAALDEDTAVAETVFHTARFLRETAEPPIEVERRCYVGKRAAAARRSPRSRASRRCVTPTSVPTPPARPSPPNVAPRAPGA